MFCGTKNLRPFKVRVHLDGRHPYLTGHELDYETRDIELTVPAKDWNHAAKVAMEATRTVPNKWSWRVTGIEDAS